MKRRFSIVEEVRIEYTYTTSDEEDMLIEEKYHGSFEEYIQDKGVYTLFDNSTYEQILDYIETDYESFCEES